MGAVYEVRHEELGHSVALKEAFHTDDESLRRAFKREARTLAGLQHSGLPRVIDYFAEGDGLYLVMEYVDGDDLLKLLDMRGEPFTSEEVMGWMEQLLDVLEYLHTRPTPVIHRDIKPSNIKLSPSGKVILLDFGLSKGVAADASSVVASRSVFGFTLNYAPLEQILKADPNRAQPLTMVDADRVERILLTPTAAASDIYSLAATLYHLLTNQQPVQAPTRAVAVWSGKPDPLRPADKVNPRVPRDLAALLQKALRLDITERLGSAAEMREGLAEVLRRLGQTTDPTPAPAPPPAPRPILARLLAFLPEWSRPYALPAIGALLLATVLSTVFMLRPRSTSPPDPAVTSGASAASPTPLPPPESLADDDLIPFRKGNKWGFSLADRRIVVAPKYDGFEPFDGGLAKVWYTEQSGGDTRGSKSSKPRNVKKRYGFINKAGKEVIEVKYRDAGTFKNDLIRAFNFSDPQPICFRRKDDGVDPVGCPTPTASSPAPTPAPTRAPPVVFSYETNDDGKCRFVDGDLNPMTGYVYDECSSLSENMAGVRVGAVWGFIDASGRLKIQPRFQAVKYFSGELAAAQQNNLWGFINKNGDWVIQVKYTEVCQFSEGWACVKDRETGKYGYVDRAGTVWIRYEYDGAEPFRGGVARVKKVSREDDKDVTKYGYINTKNESVFSISYEAIEFPFGGEWAKFRRDGKWGVINKAEKVVVEPKYKDIKSYDLRGKLSNKLWRVELDGGIYFYISRDGTEYYEPEEDPAKQLTRAVPPDQPSLISIGLCNITSFMWYKQAQILN
jgi:serine/threonine protein kinase